MASEGLRWLVDFPFFSPTFFSLIMKRFVGVPARGGGLWRAVGLAGGGAWGVLNFGGPGRR